MSIENIFQAILDFDQTRVADLVESEVAAGSDIKTILSEGLISAMNVVGERFSKGIFFVPEMLQCARAMKVGMEILRPHLAETDIKPKGTIIIGTVKEDLHDIGKNLVTMMLEGGGFNVIDLGVDVETAGFLKAIQEYEADMIALSALLTTTMVNMEKTLEAVKKDVSRIKIIVGGAPVNQSFANKVGADGYSDDAGGAVELAKRLITQE